MDLGRVAANLPQQPFSGWIRLIPRASEYLYLSLPLAKNHRRRDIVPQDTTHYAFVTQVYTRRYAELAAAHTVNSGAPLRNTSRWL